MIIDFQTIAAASIVLKYDWRPNHVGAQAKGAMGPWGCDRAWLVWVSFAPPARARTHQMVQAHERAFYVATLHMVALADHTLCDIMCWLKCPLDLPHAVLWPTYVHWFRHNSTRRSITTHITENTYLFLQFIPNWVRATCLCPNATK